MNQTEENQALIYQYTLLNQVGIQTEIDDDLLKSYQKLLNAALNIIQPTIQSSKNSTSIPLRSILSQINPESANKKSETYYHKPASLNINDVDKASVFPEETQSRLDSPVLEVSKQIRQCLDELKTKIKEARVIKDISSYNYTIYHLIHAYTSRISALSQGKPEYEDVSLFDYTRSLAGLINCLNHQDNNQESETTNLLLIKAGIPSIQKFIYSGIDISQVGGSDKLSKKLRGRSFYVNLLTNFLADLFLEELGLTEANLIFTSGGHFLMLAPSHENITHKIDELKKEVNLELMKEVGTRLGLEIAYKQVEAKELFQNSGLDKNPGFHIADISTELDEVRKYRKHEAYLERMFYPEKDPQTTQSEDTEEPVNEDDTSQERVNPGFQDDLWLGTNIPYSDYIVQIKLEKGAETKKSFTELSHERASETGKISEGVKAYVAKWLTWQTVMFMPRSRKDDPTKLKNPSTIIGEVKRLLDHYKGDIESVKFILLNKTGIADYFELAKDFEFPITFGFRFLGSEARQFFRSEDYEILAKKYPTNNPGDVLPFEELQKLKYDYKENKNSQEVASNQAKKEDSSKLSYPMLAVMRLDVDYLGGIFAHGLGKEVAFTRIATLSRELDMFFSGYFNTLVNKYQLYTTYSGGDDAFVVGSWYNLMHFAKTFHEKFKKFACDNKYVNFSAGIFFCDSHYPVAKFAEDAAKLEELSKKFKGEKDIVTKNAITVFDHTLSWDNYKAQIDFAEKVWKCIEGTNTSPSETPKFTRAVIHKLLRMIQFSLEKKTINQRRFHRNRAQLHGLLSRQGFNQKNIDELTSKLMQEVIEKIIQDFKNHKKALDDTIAFNYVLWKTRKLE